MTRTPCWISTTPGLHPSTRITNSITTHMVISIISPSFYPKVFSFFIFSFFFIYLFKSLYPNTIFVHLCFFLFRLYFIFTAPSEIAREIEYTAFLSEGVHYRLHIMKGSTILEHYIVATNEKKARALQIFILFFAANLPNVLVSRQNT